MFMRGEHVWQFYISKRNGAYTRRLICTKRDVSCLNQLNEIPCPSLVCFSASFAIVLGSMTIYMIHPITIVKHDDVIKWKHFPRYWPFVRGIHRSPVNSPHKGQWRGALMFSLICVWINGWVNKYEAGYWRRHRGDYDVIVMNQYIH